MSYEVKIGNIIGNKYWKHFMLGENRIVFKIQNDQASGDPVKGPLKSPQTSLQYGIA